MTLRVALSSYAVAVLTVACSGSVNPSGTDGGVPAPSVLARIVHMSQDTPPFDVCFAESQGTSVDWSGRRPRLGGAGIAFGQVTPYLELVAGSYAMRVVGVGSADCTVPLTGDAVHSLRGTRTTLIADGGFQLNSSSREIVKSIVLDIATEGVTAFHDFASVPMSFGTGSLAGGDYREIAFVNPNLRPWRGTLPFPSSGTLSGHLASHPDAVVGDGAFDDAFVFANARLGASPSLFIHDTRSEGRPVAILCADDADPRLPTNPTCTLQP